MNMRSILCKKNFVVGLSAFGLALTGCTGDDGGTDGGTAEPVSLPESAADAVANYANIVHASYQDSHTSAVALDSAITSFVATPSASGLTAAREAWLASREPYLQTEVYRFYDGPIDNPTDGPEGLINAWPLDESYIDYVEGNATSGIVNGTQTIDASTLESLNEQGGEENIATGFHAIEFLLWGQDLSSDGPGARPHTDYLTTGGTASNQDRRATYLTTASTMMLGHLEGLVDAWAADVSDNYRASFEAEENEEAFRRILVGMIVLSGFETGGERLQTALDSGDQEDEHSCFSDNTHRDMVQDVQGVLNVWNGSYTRLDGSTVSGVGIGEVVEAVDQDLADSLQEKIEASLSLAQALVPPFDNEIAADNTEGRARVQSLVTSLREQEELLEDVFRLFQFSIPEPE